MASPAQPLLPNSSRRMGSRAASLANVSFGTTDIESGTPTIRQQAQREKGTAAWFDEFKDERRAEEVLHETLQPNPVLQRHNVPHVFTKDERGRMDKYESIDYWEPQSLIYKDHIRVRRQQHRWTKWIVFSLVGGAVGLWSMLLFQTLFLLSDLKVDTFEEVIRQESDKIYEDANWNATHAVTRGGIPVAAAMKGYFVWMLWCCCATVCSSLCCVVMPAAAGSGVPEVMAYLNGVALPRIFNIRVLFIKTLSCILCVNAGLPVGAEGPMIHCGALIGAGLPTGRSRSLRCSFGALLGTFRNTKDHRDFIAAGSAAGVTAAFGSPIGGLLFVMEEVASFFPPKLAWLVFFTCLSCTFVMHVFNSFIDGWEIQPRSGMPMGNLQDTVVTLFNTDYSNQHVPMNIFTFVPAVIIGVLMGLMGVFFILLNTRVLRLRNKYINPSAIKRVVEPVAFMMIYASLLYFSVFAFECKPLSNEMRSAVGSNIQFVTAFCRDPKAEFHPMATLVLTSPYNQIRLMYTRFTRDIVPWEALMMYQVLYTVGAAVVGGMFLSSGLVIPTLVAGAIGGRAIGTWIGQPWADPGVCALIGSGAFFGGLGRLTFSLAVIMMEITSDLTHIPTLMVGVFVGKVVADRFCHSLYHSILEVKCVPFLDVSARVHHLDTHTAKDIMAANPKCVPTVCKIVQIVELLKTTTHNCFPVVSLADKKTFKGTIQRAQLETLLWFIHFRETEEFFTNSAHATYADLQAVKERQFWGRLPAVPALSAAEVDKNLDLNPYIDTGAFFVHETMSISKTYELLRNMGLRHVVVVNRHNAVTGMISRKNVIGDRMAERLASCTSPRNVSTTVQ